MQHPFEPVSSVIRKLTDPDYAGCRLWDDITAVVPNIMQWITAFQTDKKLPPEAIHFLVKTGLVRSRLTAPKKPSSLLVPGKSYPDPKKILAAVIMTATSVLATFPFTVVFVTAATGHGRFPALVPFRGNIRTFRTLVAQGSVLSLWRGSLPMVLASVVNDFTSRLRLGKIATAVAHLLEYAFEVVSVRMMCWDTRLAAGWTSVGPVPNFITGYVSRVCCVCGLGWGRLCLPAASSGAAFATAPPALPPLQPAVSQRWQPVSCRSSSLWSNAPALGTICRSQPRGYG